MSARSSRPVPVDHRLLVAGAGSLPGAAAALGVVAVTSLDYGTALLFGVVAVAAALSAAAVLAVGWLSRSYRVTLRWVVIVNVLMLATALGLLAADRWLVAVPTRELYLGVLVAGVAGTAVACVCALGRWNPRVLRTLVLVDLLVLGVVVALPFVAFAAPQAVGATGSYVVVESAETTAPHVVGVDADRALAAGDLVFVYSTPSDGLEEGALVAYWTDDGGTTVARGGRLPASVGAERIVGTASATLPVLGPQETRIPHVGSVLHAVGSPSRTFLVGLAIVLLPAGLLASQLIRDLARSDTWGNWLTTDRLRHAAGGLLLVALVAPFVVAGVPQVVGATQSYTVMSGSMEPGISPGDTVVVRDVPASQIEPGDVITYEFETGRAGVARRTHRVVGVVNRETGRYFRTKGDANEDADQQLVPVDAVVGRVMLTIPYVGYVILFASTGQGLFLLVVLPGVLLFVSELWSLVSAIRASRAAGASTDRDADTADRPTPPTEGE